MINFYSTISNKFISPSTSFGNANVNVRKHSQFKYGWFFHVPYYLEYVTPTPSDVVPIPTTGFDDVRTMFNKTTMPDWDNMASLASGASVDYVVLQIKNGRGFRFWDSQALDNYNGGSSHSYNGFTVPLYTNFKITKAPLSLDNSYIQDAINSFNSLGIEVVLYYDIGFDYNLRTDLTTTESITGGASFYAYYDVYHDFVKAEIQEILTTFKNFNYMWWDNTVRYPQIDSNGNDARYSNYLSLYNAAKAIRQNICIISNILSSLTITNDSLYQNGKLKFFPTDIKAVEEPLDTIADKSEYNSTTTHDSVDYYIPSEVAYTGLFRDAFWQYPWLDNTTGYWTGYGINQIQTQQQFQDGYDVARSYGVPFLCNVPLRHNTNDIDSTYLSRLQGLTL